MYDLLKTAKASFDDHARTCDCCKERYTAEEVTYSIKLGGWYCEQCKKDCEDSDNN